MLGRLQMSTEDALTQYNSLAERIFGSRNKKSISKPEYFRATTVASEVISLVDQKADYSGGWAMLPTSSLKETGKA